MPDTQQLTAHILAATDFGKQGERAFHHALRLAVARQAHLTLLHTGPEGRKAVPWERYPGVRDTLLKWQLLGRGALRTDVWEQLGLDVKKMALRDQDTYHGMLDYLRQHPTDLLVMDTGAGRGLARMRRTSLALAVAHSTHSHALLLPETADDLVDPENGRRKLSKAMFVYQHQADPRLALEWLNQWLPMFSEGQVELDLLYLGEENASPDIVLPANPAVKWQRIARSGPALETIVAQAQAGGAELITMINQPARGFTGRLRGGLGDQVLRRVGKPMLLLPGP